MDLPILCTVISDCVFVCAFIIVIIYENTKSQNYPELPEEYKLWNGNDPLYIPFISEFLFAAAFSFAAFALFFYVGFRCMHDELDDTPYDYDEDFNKFYDHFRGCRYVLSQEQSTELSTDQNVEQVASPVCNSPHEHPVLEQVHESPRLNTLGDLRMHEDPDTPSMLELAHEHSR
jgi:hypothetical protein